MILKMLAFLPSERISSEQVMILLKKIMYWDVTDNDLSNFKTIKDFYKEEYFYESIDDVD